MFKNYNHTIIEETINNYWKKTKTKNSRKSLPTYTMVLPPPNITGKLHIGHALNICIQDVIIRQHHMRGYNTTWIPGIDHAGIATQLVVEKELTSQNKTKEQLGRKLFVEEIWQWKKNSENNIVNQLKKLGIACNWEHMQFTMDNHINKAVIRSFVLLYEQGLIYRDQRMVNWDTKLQTAVADLEVKQQTIMGKMWYIKYLLTDKPEKNEVIVGTTRPETLLGDTAVCVHPKDKRYSHLVGKKVFVPFTGRTIPIIKDDYVDPEKGTGIVKITPGHDFNDNQVGVRNKLPTINIFNEDGKLNANAPSQYQGLTIKQAREEIIKDLQEQNLLQSVETIRHTVPFGDRSHTVIEPRLTWQWFIDTPKIKQKTIDNIANQNITFFPQHWKNVCLNWLENLEPWCISRQLWWGHQIPAWFGPDNKVFVAHNTEEALEQAKNIYNHKNFELKQETDVLDTWYSSALWSFTTLGWPEKTTQYPSLHPLDCIVSGEDIIFYWLTRMMIMSQVCTKSIPFREVIIHGLICDEHGQKMSKFKGNVINPETIIEMYGTDNLRWTMCNLPYQNKQIKLNDNSFIETRNFITKLCNIIKYCQTQSPSTQNSSQTQYHNPINIWITKNIHNLVRQLNNHMQNYKLTSMTHTIYNFVWKTFCDWYLEFTKIILTDPNVNTKDKQETRNALQKTTQTILTILHPFIPFITEYLWLHALNKKTSLMHEPWPKNVESKLADTNTKIVNKTIGIITDIRSMKTKLKIKNTEVLPALSADKSCTPPYSSIIEKLAGIKFIDKLADTTQYFTLKMTSNLDMVIYIKKQYNCVNTTQQEIIKVQQSLEILNDKFQKLKHNTKIPKQVILDHKNRIENTKLELDNLNKLYKQISSQS